MNQEDVVLSFIDKNPHMALSYLTTGQTVPTDIELVNPAKFSDSILQSNIQNTRI
jgi:flagellar biosynthesis GTPase FlhF